jgi:glutathione S-transferase
MSPSSPAAPAELTLVLATKNYSSWSWRPWLALKKSGLPFREVLVHLGTPETTAEILRHSPTGRVPALRHGDLTVWDSLAICEYVAELAPGAQLWPAEREARAVARAVSAEMHSGFTALRTHLPMNVTAHKPGRGLSAAGVAEDVARVQALVEDCRARFGRGGPFLFGAWSLADAMYTPVVSRFRTYGVELASSVRVWADAVWEEPAVREWREACAAEGHRLAKYED